MIRMDREARDAALKTLKTLEEQRTKTDVAISALRSLLEMPEYVPHQLPLAERAATSNGRPASPSLLSSVIAYLRAVGRPQTTGQISVALRSAGYKSASKNFTNTVYARLYTAHRAGDEEIERTADGAWGLIEWGERKPT